MSAEDLGRRLLADVHEERLDELLSYLRVLHDPSSTCRLGIPQIDALLALFAGVQPPPVQQTRQPAPIDVWERNDTDDAIIHRQPLVSVKQKTPPIVEITSPGPNNGKSQLLYYMTAMSILPKNMGEVSLEGQDAAVVVLDTESRFSVMRLAQIMRHYIHMRISSNNQDAATTETTTTTPSTATTPPIPSTSAIESTILEALNHVHIYRPQSLASLTATLTTIPTHLLNTSAHHSSKRHVAQMILDSASSFFWQDKADAETASLPPDSSSNEQASTAPPRKPRSGYVALASAVRETSARLMCPFVYTMWDLSGGAGQQGRGDQVSEMGVRSHLPLPWQSVPTLRLVVSRKAVRKFPVGMTAREAVGQREARERAVRGGVFEVRVNRWGEDDWTQRVIEGLRRLGGGGFEVVVGAFGVVVDG